MQSVYHGVPDRMIGNVLYPLNDLRHRHPEAYVRESAKYLDHPSRTSLPMRRIEVLDCLWNDVLHTSSIHPHLLFLEWRGCGLALNPDRAFHRIPIHHVAELPLAIMRSGQEAELLKPSDYHELEAVPAEIASWYRKISVESDSKPRGTFVGVPHVLVKGEMDITGVDIIRWGYPDW
jgi:hypothetical protein